MKYLKLIKSSFSILMCFCIATSIIGCQKVENKLSAFGMDLYDEGVAVDNKALYMPWINNEEIANDYIPEEKELSIVYNGKEYNAEYKESTILKYSDYVYYVYVTPDDYEFYINAQTGENEIFINYMCRKDDRESISWAECKEISDNLAKEYIDIETCKFEENIMGDFGVRYKYTKCLGDLKTGEEIFVEMLNNGTLIQFNRRMTNRFPDSLLNNPEVTERINELQSESALETLDEYLNETFKNNFPDGYPYNIQDKRLVYTIDGSLAMVYRIWSEEDRRYAEVLIK